MGRKNANHHIVKSYGFDDRRPLGLQILANQETEPINHYALPIPMDNCFDMV